MIVQRLLSVLTVAVVVAALLGALALVRRATTDPRARLVGTTLLLAWFGVAVLLSWAGFFVPSSPPPPVPPLALTLLPLVALAIATAASAEFRRLLDAVPPSSLVRVQLYRSSGALVLAQLLLGALPASFAIPTGLGSVVVAVGAFFVSRRIERPGQRGESSARRLALAWNVVGLAELFAALPLGAATAPSHPRLVQFPMVAIAAFVVPLSLFLHLASVRACLRLDAARAAGDRAAA